MLHPCADSPSHGDNAYEDGAHDGCVGFPIRRLGIPTTGRRPDVLWVPVRASDMQWGLIESVTYGTFPPPPIVMCNCADWCVPSTWSSRHEVADGCELARARFLAEILW